MKRRNFLQALAALPVAGAAFGKSEPDLYVFGDDSIEHYGDAFDSDDHAGSSLSKVERIAWRQACDEFEKCNSLADCAKLCGDDAKRFASLLVK